jgi:aspartyl-tRNA(Asn)/glutamyl-tRNA(Gln) amidotransferase subunit C
MELHPDDLKRIARLARIAVSEAEMAPLQSQLNGIFGLIDALQAVDTQGITPLAHPLDVVQHLPQRLREDRVTEPDERASNMANAPAVEAGLFLVPKVIE